MQYKVGNRILNDQEYQAYRAYRFQVALYAIAIILGSMVGIWMASLWYAQPHSVKWFCLASIASHIFIFRVYEPFYLMLIEKLVPFVWISLAMGFLWLVFA